MEQAFLLLAFGVFKESLEIERLLAFSLDQHGLRQLELTRPDDVDLVHPLSLTVQDLVPLSEDGVALEEEHQLVGQPSPGGLVEGRNVLQKGDLVVPLPPLYLINHLVELLSSDYHKVAPGDALDG